MPCAGWTLACVAVFAAWQLTTYSGTSARAAKFVVPGAWAVVAGGSDGIGAEWATLLAGRGMNLVLIGRRETPLKVISNILTNNTGVKVVALQLDLALLTVEQIQSKIISDRDIRLLVYNAAFTGPKGGFVGGDLKLTLTALNVNVRSLAMLTHVVARHLLVERREGGIVLMSSLTGALGSGWVANYAATKAYITALARGLDYELRPHRINVLSCVAGATVTPTYLKSVSLTRNKWIEQTPHQVVSECMAGLGRTSAVMTGPLNKFSRALFARFLPADLAVKLFSDQAGAQMGFNHTANLNIQLF